MELARLSTLSDCHVLSPETAVAPSAVTSRLLALPAELRNAIVDLVLPENEELVIGMHDAMTPALLRTCREFRRTYSTRFYNTNIFVINALFAQPPVELVPDCWLTADRGWVGPNEKAQKWLERTSREHLSLMKHIRLVGLAVGEQTSNTRLIPHLVESSIGFDIVMPEPHFDFDIGAVKRDTDGGCIPFCIESEYKVGGHYLKAEALQRYLGLLCETARSGKCLASDGSSTFDKKWLGRMMWFWFSLVRMLPIPSVWR